MIDLTPPYAQIHSNPGSETGEAIQVFRDHADPDLFHYLPPSPRLVLRDDKPAFTLHVYRRSDDALREDEDARGGGLALMEVEAALPAGKHALLQSEVATRFERPDARLVPALFRSARVDAIIAHSEDDRLIEDLVVTRVASPLAPHRAAIALGLSPDGAALVEAAARGGELPVGVVYEMRFDALLPSLHARVTMDYERMYDRFAAGISFTIYYVSADLGVDLAWMIQNDLIDIEITKFSSDEDAAKQEELVHALVTERVKGDFFRTAMPPKPGEKPNPLGGLLGGLFGGGGGEVGGGTALFTLKAKYEMERELKTFEMIFEGRTAQELVHTAPGFLSTSFEGYEPDIRHYDANNPFWGQLSVAVQPAIDWDALPELLGVTVTLRKDDRVRSEHFERGSSESFDWVVATERGDDAYTWEVEYRFDVAQGAGPSTIAAGPYERDLRALVISPLEHVRLLPIRVQGRPLDWAETPRLHVHLRVPGPRGEDRASTTLLITEAEPEQQWRVRLAREEAPPAVVARVEAEGADGRLRGGAEEPVQGGLLTVRGPAVAKLAVRLVPVADWERVERVIVDVRHGEGEHLTESQHAFNEDGPPEVPLAFPLTDLGERSWRWREVVLFADGSRDERDWVVSDDTLAYVGASATEDLVLRVILLVVGEPPLGVQLDLWVKPAGEADEVQLSEFLAPDQREVKLTLPASDEGLKYRYTAVAFTVEGERELASGEADSAVLVLRA